MKYNFILLFFMDGSEIDSKNKTVSNKGFTTVWQMSNHLSFKYTEKPNNVISTDTETYEEK